MVKAKIAVNGYGTIGKRVADAVQGSGRYGSCRNFQDKAEL